MFLISILLLKIFPLEITNKNICSSEENLLISDSHIMIKDQNAFQLIQQKQSFTLFDPIHYQLQDFNLTLLFQGQYQDRFQFIFQNSNTIHIRICVLHFSIMQNQITDYTFQIENQILIQPIGKLLHSYNSKSLIYLVYEEQLDNNDYLIQITNLNSQNVLKIIRVKKIQNCAYSLQDNEYQFFYFAQYNCTDWEVQLYSFDSQEIHKTIKYDQFKSILRQIQIKSIQSYLILTFDNYVYNYHSNNDNIEIVFQSTNRNIFYYDEQYQILSEIQADEHPNLNSTAFIRSQRPKKILEYNQELIFLYDSRIEHVKNIDLQFYQQIQLDDIIYFKSTHPYIYGVQNNQLILIRINQLNPLFKCMENMSFNAQFYQDQIKNPKKDKQVNNMKNMEIKNQQIQFVNIFENIVQVEIPIYTKEFQQNNVEIEINLNEFFLGGPFYILNAKSDKKYIIDYEMVQFQIFQFFKFNQVLWWQIISNNNLEIILFVYNRDSMFYLINCNKNTTQKIIKLDKIEKSQVYFTNYEIIIKINKQVIYTITFSKDFTFRIKKILFESEIKYIQPKHTYFMIYLQQEYKQYPTYHQIQIVFEGQLKDALLRSDIILQKSLNENIKITATESKVLIQNRKYQHIIEIPNILDILQVKININQYVIIHKIKILDQIRIELCKYYLINFQFKKMYSLPMPIKSFEYIFPINIDENGVILTIAAKDTITNNIYVLIYEISLSCSKVLKEIIQIDCCSCFQLISDDLIVYQFENMIKQRQIQSLKFKVQFQNDNNPIANFIDISVSLKSKLTNMVKHGLQIKLILYPYVEGLIQINNKLILKNFEPIIFNPKKVLFGSVSNITSQSVIITPALKKISSEILDDKSLNRYLNSAGKILTVNQQINYANYEKEQRNIEQEKDRVHQLLTDQDGSFIFQIKIINIKKVIQVFDQNLQLKTQFEIHNQPHKFIQSIISFDYVYFFIFDDIIVMYKIISDQNQYLSQINHDYIDCAIQKISNQQFQYLIYDQKSLKQNWIFMKIVENNQIEFVNLLIDIELKVNMVQTYIHKILFKNIQFNNTYLNFNMLLINKLFHSQLFQFTYDISFHQIINFIHQGVIIHKNDTYIQRFLLIDQFLVMLFNSPQKVNNSIILLYDLVQNEPFEIINSISSIEGEILDIIYHNKSFFGVIQKLENYTISMYQVNQYLFEFPQKEDRTHKINIINQLTSIEVTIEIDLDLNQYLKLGLLFINSVCIVIMLSGKRNSKKKF